MKIPRHQQVLNHQPCEPKSFFVASVAESTFPVPLWHTSHAWQSMPIHMCNTLSAGSATQVDALRFCVQTDNTVVDKSGNNMQ